MITIETLNPGSNPNPRFISHATLRFLTILPINFVRFEEILSKNRKPGVDLLNQQGHKYIINGNIVLFFCVRHIVIIT
jgi:hypothetical protein